MCAGIAATVAAILLYAVSPLMVTRLELALYDMALPLRASREPSNIPLIVDIDEYTLETVRQWPWPRYLVADLIKALQQGGAAAIAFDVLFAERDNSSPNEITGYLERDRGVNVKFEGLPSELWNYDALLAATIKDAPVVLATYAHGVPDASLDIPDAVRLLERYAPGVPSDSAYVKKLYNMESAVFPLPEFRSASLGVINIEPDIDGIIRKIPIVIAVNGKIYPTLSLRALLTALGTENLTLGVGVHGLEYVKAASYTIPVTPDGIMRIPFIGPQGTYTYVSAADVLNGKISPDFLEGCVAFVGSSARGLVDLHPTPFDPVSPGVEAHATVFDTILTGNAITEPIHVTLIQIAAIIVTGLVSTWLFGFARPMVYVPSAVVILITIIAAFAAFFARGSYISPVYAVITVIILAIALLLVRFRQEELQKLRMAESLAEERAKRAKEQAELDTARRIQASSLTHDFPPYENFSDVEVYASMKAALDVGGDFYDCFLVGPGRLAIVIADVSGKGVPAALFMMAAKTVIRNQALSGGSPHEILISANDLLCRDNEAGMFVTVFVGIYNKDLKVLQFANAGHTPPLLMRDGASYLQVEKNFVLGGIEGIEYTTETISFGEGDAIVLYTDGVTEMMNERQEFFGENKLVDLLQEMSANMKDETITAHCIVDAISNEVALFAGDANPSDDITILVLQCPRVKSS